MNVRFVGSGVTTTSIHTRLACMKSPHPNRGTVAALAFAVVAACGSSGTGGSVDGGGSSRQVTLSGAVAGTFSCLITLA